MKPTLRSTHVFQNRSCTDPFDQCDDPELRLVDGRYCPLEQVHRTVRVDRYTDPQVPARNTRAAAEKLRYRKRESQHGFSFFLSRRENKECNET
jgi:hypothetical protein